MNTVPLEDVEIVDVKQRHYDTDLQNIIDQLHIDGVPTLINGDSDNLIRGADVFRFFTQPPPSQKRPERRVLQSDGDGGDDAGYTGINARQQQPSFDDDIKVPKKIDNSRLARLKNRYDKTPIPL